MNNITKNALEESLKKFLLKKPLDKITISDLTTTAESAEWLFTIILRIFMILWNGPVLRMLPGLSREKKTYDTWQEGILQIFEVVLENKPFILNVYRCVSREQMENYLFSLTYQLIEGVVEEQSVKSMDVPEERTGVYC